MRIFDILRTWLLAMSLSLMPLTITGKITNTGWPISGEVFAVRK